MWDTADQTRLEEIRIKLEDALRKENIESPLPEGIQERLIKAQEEIDRRCNKHNAICRVPGKDCNQCAELERKNEEAFQHYVTDLNALY